MKTKNLILCSLLLSTTFIGYAKSDDSVVVNLHVLDGLSGSFSAGSYVAQQPLFPIVKKSPIITAKKVQIKSELAATAPKAKTKQNKAQQPEEPTSAAPQPAQQIPFIESNEPVVVVDVEPVSTPTPEEVAPTSLSPTSEAGEVVNTESSKEEIISPKLLIDENAVNLPKATLTTLSFASDSDEVTEELQKQIDQIIASFTDATNNKIAIYSYNLDDGVDTFKKKRISLNRAVAVRSYLLPKGYKNFSIKVINIDGSSDKVDTVELEELKN